MKIQFDKSGIVNTLAAIAIVSVLMVSGLVTAYRPPMVATADGDGDATITPGTVTAGAVTTLNYTYHNASIVTGGHFQLAIPPNWTPNPQTANAANPSYVQIASNSTATLTVQTSDIYIWVNVTAGTLATTEAVWITIKNITAQTNAATVVTFSGFSDTNGDFTTLPISPQATLSVVPGPYKQLAWSWSVTTITAGEAGGSLRIHLADQYGNTPTNHPDILVNLTSSSMWGVFNNGTANITTVTILNGTTASIVFNYNDTHAGDFTLTARNHTLSTPNAVLSFTVNADTPTQIYLAGPASATAGTESAMFAVSLVDQYNNPCKPAVNTIIWLNSSNGGTAKQFRLTPGGSAISNVTIGAGSNGANFYYYDETAGTFTITATSGTLADSWQPYTILPAAPHHVFLDGAANFPVGTNASYFVKIMDQYNNAITVASNTVVNLATNSTTGVFMHYITGAPITSVTIPAASDTGNFNFTDSVAGAKNLIGNSSGVLNASVTVWVLDLTGPTIINSTPADGAVNVTTAAGNLTFTFSEPLVPSPPTTYPAENIPGIDYDNASWSVGNTVLTIPYGALADETDYYIDFTGVDMFDTSGNQLVGMNITFTTGDCTLPIITLDSPLDGAFIQAGTDIALTVTDINLDAVNYSVNGATAVALASPYDIETASWEDDIFIIVVTAADLAGNEAMETYIFTVDSTEPTITLNSPADGSRIMTGTVLDFTAADAHLGIVRYALDTNALQTFAAPYNLNTAGWADGTHMVRIQADDTVGNTAVAYFNFTADGTAPTVISIVPADGTDNVALDTHIVITFSEPMDNVSVYSAIQFSPPITCLFEWNANNTVLTLTPTEDLAESTVHGISLGVGATDIVGNNLDSAFSSSFATPTAEPIVEDIEIVIGPVLDAEGNPIVGAAVVVTLDGEAYTGTTDADGNANITLPGTAVGEQISVEITKDGYRTVAYTTTIAADGTVPASDNPPTMEDEVDGDIDYTMIIIIVVAIIIVAIAVVFMLMGKKPAAPKSAEEPEEEAKEPEQAPDE
ncbi:MAG: Ig-like domain-containing protein [Thermoplasmata archaeon]|nr:Ig-like domain-containing protein [Thermoplasmata archaeon]